MSPDYRNMGSVMCVERIKLPNRHKDQVKLPLKIRQISTYPTGGKD